MNDQPTNPPEQKTFEPSGSGAGQPAEPAEGVARTLPDGTTVRADGLRVSRTGAVLGRPDDEFPAYGMTAGERPAQGTEREMRGVEAPALPPRR